jgi:hypothetical protein
MYTHNPPEQFSLVTRAECRTGSNALLYGRTDTKSPMVYSSMVHVAGGEGGSIRHDHDGRPPSGPAVTLQSYPGESRRGQEPGHART